MFTLKFSKNFENFVNIFGKIGDFTKNFKFL